jgi:hypothetical protein
MMKLYICCRKPFNFSVQYTVFIAVGIFPIKFFIEREPHSQPEISKREIEGQSGRRGENRGREQVVACLARY